jgi:2-phospho-L-lactate guanylyltransferase
MLHDVVDAVAASTSLADVVFVTADPFARALARRIGARILHEDASDGQTAAIMAAARMLAAERRGAMLTIPGDVPLVTADEINTVIDQHPVGDAFTIVPSHDELGSNAVLCSPPNRVPLRFGDNSYYPHVEAARRCGLVPKIVRLPGLALDIDHPRDVQALLRRPARTRAHAILQKFGVQREQNVCQQTDDTNIGH